MDLPRTNMTHRAAETWRPPPLTSTTFLSASLRRFLDLQAGSIWRDMDALLPRLTGRLLDVGCGAQPYRPLLPKTVEYLGIDTADAESHFGYAQPDTRYFPAGSPWPVDDHWADTLLATETMEHVPDPAAFARECARALKPNGLLILTVPFSARYHFIPHDYWRYTPTSLSMLLTTAGFTNIRVYARGNAVTVACYKTMALILSLLFTPPTKPIPSGVGSSSTQSSVLSPQSSLIRFLRILLGLLLSPHLIPLSILANLSLLGQGGDDCLGYTVLADNRSPQP